MSIRADYIERCYAGWLGKVIGVRYGAPIEGWTYEAIRRVYGELDGYLVDYRDFAADDDTNGPLFFLKGLEDDPELKMTDAQMGEAWLNYIPYEHGILWWGGYGNSTEHTAYLNLRAGIPAPRSGSIAQNGLAVAQQIGGQIFSDCWGLIWPGNPEKAAEYARIAARVSHDGEAVYGGQVVAASIAAAFEEKDIRKVLETALALIPEDSEYARMARDIFLWHDEHPNCWRDAMDHIIACWGYDRYPGSCHVIPNSAVMLMSMLYGGGDFTKTINICNMCGWDTDCNVGNVGTILGVLCGLEGIEDRWRTPINDFLVASSVVGKLNITTLPDYVRRLAAIAYRLADEEAPDQWRDFMEQRHTVDFRLPRSTCAFRMDGEGNRTEDCMSWEGDVWLESKGALKTYFRNMGAGQRRRIYYGTYYHPSDFHDSRYDPAFSPVVYPGQTITFQLRTDADADVCLYYMEDHEGKIVEHEHLRVQKAHWTQLTMQIPGGTDARISQVGVSAARTDGAGDLLIYIDSMDIGGKADYCLNFAKEKMEQWPRTLHKEITQMTRLKGLWEIWDGKLIGSCSDFGEAYSGDPEWENVELTFRWRPETSYGKTGVGVRIQGGVRGYALLADRETLSICRKGLGYEELVRCARPAEEILELTVRCIDTSIEVFSHGERLLSWEDTTLGHGMLGLVVTDGGRAAYEWVRVKAL